MKHLFAISMVMLLALGAALAQTNPVNTAAQPQREGKVIAPESPTMTDSAGPTASNLRPLRPERPKLPAAVSSTVERFKLEARAYLNQEEALKKQLQGSNDEDRARIRERIKLLREQWSERARDLRKEFKERRDELAAKMPDRQELFDSIRDNAQQQVQDGRPPRSRFDK